MESKGPEKLYTIVEHNDEGISHKKELKSTRSEIDELEDKFRKAEFESKIKKLQEKDTRRKIIISIAAVGSFIIVSHLFFMFMFANQNDEISRALSLVAGFFSAFFSNVS